jgi:hypothetical protein
MQERKRHGRFTPDCGNIWTAPVPPLSATNGHTVLPPGATMTGVAMPGVSARLAMHSVAARVETLRSAERALYQSVKLSRAMPLNREPAPSGIPEEQQHSGA